jgi:primosomal protein N'
MVRAMVECLSCGKQREQPEEECPRCSYVGWAYVEEIDEALRRLLRERTVAGRSIRIAS